ncbi:hypothetical protein M407DRAFT_30676 [Tulasnella calospora MUT 4182]|uniref:Protein kinase domain-containing protein n=1 Tax=Tulasnella calospora MUT 4182 TaxID=1051891 RepID=A0A0C3LDX4_9AGAM|nr:hypothetical protein M407DRAFT_30676 [Tulasnella calospora MUT 4182]
MGDCTNENEEASQPANAQKAGIDDFDESVERIRIHPRKLLGSLGHLRINIARIKPIEGKASEGGGTANVEAAILTPAQSPNIPESDDIEYIAVKKLRLDAENDDGQALAAFAHEVSLLDGLSHESVASIIGFVEDIEHGVAWMVFSWEQNGNLREFVRSANWELPERVSLIDDIARGLSYLHGRNPPICHGDMKSLNILVNSEHQAIITDFGSARPVIAPSEPTVGSVNPVKAQEPHAPVIESLKVEVDSSGGFVTMAGPAWTTRWAAPELLAGHPPGLASDVWALGWICWEAVTGNIPFDNLEQPVPIIVRITKGDLPVVKNNGQLRQIGTLCSLMEECWKLDAKSRPTAARCQQVVSFMDQALPWLREGGNLDIPRSSGLLYALGRIQLRNDMIPEARRYLQQALDVSNLVGDERGKARALQALGDGCYPQSEHSKAEESLIQARDIFSRIGEKLGFAQSVHSLGDVYLKRSDYFEAKKLYIQARGIYFQIGDQLGSAQLAHGLGEAYRSLTEYSKAEESLIQARDIFSQIGDELGFAQSVRSLGDVYRMQGEYSKAEGCFIMARDVFTQIGDQLGFAQSVKSLGEVYRMQGEYSKAEELYIQSRDIFSQIRDELGFAQSVEGLGEVYHMRNEYAKAEESLIQARDSFDRIGNKLGFAQSVRRLGEVYHMQSKYFEAEESLIQARDIFSQIGDQLGFADSLGSLGEVYRMRTKYAEAEKSLIRARDIFSQIGNQLGFAQSLNGLGEVYSLQREYSEAEKSYIEARNIFNRIGDQLGAANSIQGLGGVHSAQGHYAKAEELYLEAQQLYSQTGDIRSSAGILWHLGWLHRDMAQYDDAARLVREASTIYGALGLKEDVADCDDFLDEIRQLTKN